MFRLTTFLVLFLCGIMNAQSKYETAMNQAFQNWTDGNSTEAIARFERIAAVEKENWLPNYYVVLINVTNAFQNLGDTEKLQSYLGKAQEVIAVELSKYQENAELLVLDALINTAWIASDPMANGMKLSGKVMETYAKAQQIEPENPRVIFCKAEFELGGAQYFKQDIKPICERIDHAIKLFANFKSEIKYYPDWGLDRAIEIQKQCGGK